MFEPVYLDYNATAPVLPEVLEAMLPWLGKRHGNPSSRHEFGRAAQAALEKARYQVAAAVNAHPTEVIFTSGGSEANNLFLKGAAANFRPGGLRENHLVISPIEHPCVREPAKQLVKQGWHCHELRVDALGQVQPDSVTEKLALRPRLWSVMLANNETGIVQNIAALAQQIRPGGGWLHCDAVQALGKIPLDFRGLGVDGLTLSAHKIGGGLGAGALIVNKRIELQPLIAGGGQERGIRSGTENVAAIVGFGVAAELAVQRLQAYQQRMDALRERLVVAVREMGATVFGWSEDNAVPRLPNTVFFAFPQLEGETLVGKLDRAGFAVASGSACSSANPEPSRTLLAMGVEPELARGAVRVSLGWDSQPEQIENFIISLREVCEQLRNLKSLQST